MTGPTLLEVPEPRLAPASGSATEQSFVEPHSLPEYGELAVPLEELMRDGRFNFYTEAVKKNLFDVRFRGQEVVVKAGHFIGRIAVNDRLQIDVVPRVPALRLGRILRIAGQLPYEFERLSRQYGVSDDSHLPLLDVFARALLSALRPVETEGVYRRYEQHTETTSFPRGRFLLKETITSQWSRGRRDRATTSLFEHTVDNGPNRVIKLALWHLAALVAARRQQAGNQRLLSDLNRAFRLFEGVDLDLGLSALADPEVRDPGLIPANRDYYIPAVRLARAIVQRQSVELDRIGDELVLPSLLIDLQTAFEDYLRAILRSRISRLSRGLEILDGNQLEPTGGGKQLFDTGSPVYAQPDIVVRIGQGPDRFHLVGEVKYIDRDFTRDHVDQALAYALSYRTPVMLIRPSLEGEASGLTVYGTVDRKVVYSYLFDLAGDLPDEERAFAQAVRSLLTVPAVVAAA